MPSFNQKCVIPTEKQKNVQLHQRDLSLLCSYTAAEWRTVFQTNTSVFSHTSVLEEKGDVLEDKGASS